MKFLIVNADDFGYGAAINRGIVEAIDRGVVTSVGLMVNTPGTAEAVAFAKARPHVSVGLHANFTNEAQRLVEFDDPPVCRAALREQFERFADLLGRKPTHLDSHQHVHLRQPVRSIVEACARELAVPLRQCEPRIRYCGEFYGQDADGTSAPERITVEGLIGVLERLPPGITELCCHPATSVESETMYATERTRELDALCDPRVREAIARMDMALCSFRELYA